MTPASPDFPSGLSNRSSPLSRSVTSDTSQDHIHELLPLMAGESTNDEHKGDLDEVAKKAAWTSVQAGFRHPILDDPALEGMTLYEKKSYLVNRELDSHGMGKYQWCLWFLCGAGYLIDLLYAQAFGLVEPAIQQEFGFGDNKSGDIFSSFHAGLTAGAFVWGVLVDIIGRKYAFNLTVLITAAFGLCLAAPSTYNGILVLAAFNGFGLGGNIPVDALLCLEFVPQNRRFLIALLSIFQPIGVVITCGIAAGLVPKYSCGNGANGKPLKACSLVASGAECCTKASNMGWRYTLIVVGVICVVIFILRFFVFDFQESPKFFLYKGQDDKAIEVLQNVAKFNKRECGLTIDVLDALTEENASLMAGNTTSPVLGSGSLQLKATSKQRVLVEIERIKLLFSTKKVAWMTILIWITYAFDFWGFSIAGGFLPKILLAKNSTIHVSRKQSYRNFVIIYFPGIFGVLLGATMYTIPRVGRKWAMILASSMMGLSLCLFSTVNTQGANIGLNLMEYFFQSMFNAVLYAWTPEAFPAPIRGTACGIASFWGRLFSIISPLIAAQLLAISLNAPLFLAGGGVFICTIALLLMPSNALSVKTW